jgi:hypothetical protein
VGMKYKGYTMNFITTIQQHYQIYAKYGPYPMSSLAPKGSSLVKEGKDTFLVLKDGTEKNYLMLQKLETNVMKFF